MDSVLRNRSFVMFLGLVFIAFEQDIRAQALLTLKLDSLRLSGKLAWFDLALGLNGGAFLSSGDQLPTGTKQLLFIVGVAALVSCRFWCALSRWAEFPARAIAAYLLALGATSNLIDRFLHDGQVVDYLIFNLENFHAGVFNIADIAIMAGAGTLIGIEFRGHRQRYSS